MIVIVSLKAYAWYVGFNALKAKAHLEEHDHTNNSTKIVHLCAREDTESSGLRD
jgi:hypothetical protein